MPQIHLPIIKASIGIGQMLSIGAIGGLFSGLFGVGSGFFVIPILIFMGIPAKYAVSASNGQSIAASLNCVISYNRKNSVDFQIGTIIFFGSISGILLGSKLFTILTAMGLIDLVISVCYILVLGTLGIGMLLSGIKSLKNDTSKQDEALKINKLQIFIKKMPFKIYISKSDIEISILIPIFIGFVSGFLISIAGIATGFSAMPMMIHLLKMPPMLVVGTSFYNSTVICSILTITYAQLYGSVDIVLLLILMVGSSIGSIIGYKLNSKISPTILKTMLAIIVLIFVIELIVKITIKPLTIYTITEA